MTSLLQRVEEVVEDWPRSAFPLILPVPNPAALAFLRFIALLVLLGLACRVDLLAVVGRIAEADENRRLALDLLRLLPLARDAGQERLEDRRHVALLMRRGERVGEVDARRLILNACGAQALGDPQVRDGVGSDQQFKGVEPLGQAAQSVRDHPRAAVLARRLLGVLDHRQRIGAGADGRVEDGNLLLGEGAPFAEAGAQQFGRQPHLAAHDLDRREVDAAALAQLFVVGGQELLVEVEPRVLLVGARQRFGIDGGDRPLDQVDRDLKLRAGFR